MPRDNRDHEILVTQFIEDFGRLFEGFQEDISSLSQEIVRPTVVSIVLHPPTHHPATLNCMR